MARVFTACVGRTPRDRGSTSRACCRRAGSTPSPRSSCRQSNHYTMSRHTVIYHTSDMCFYITSHHGMIALYAIVSSRPSCCATAVSEVDGCRIRASACSHASDFDGRAGTLRAGGRATACLLGVAIIPPICPEIYQTLDDRLDANSRVRLRKAPLYAPLSETRHVSFESQVCNL